MRQALSVVVVVLIGGTTGWTGVGAARQGPGDRSRFTVPAGFTVEEAYAPSAARSIVMITFDSDGALVASRERGPIVRLRDTNGDGRLDAEQVVTDRVTNSQGLLYDGRDLLAVGEGPDGTGLYRVIDANGDGAGDVVALVTRSTGGIAEHGPHTLSFGPDGHLYWMLGNHTGIEPAPAPLSPFRDWREDQVIPSYTDARGHAANIRTPGGTVIRRDLGVPSSDWEFVAGGFRNAYDADFNLAGELFTFDSDMEWDINMPWYRDVRTVHVVPGGEYGWRTGSGKWPAYYPDSLPALSDIGRGSPVGIAFYQGQAYPAKYRDALFLGDWSRGRILVAYQRSAGATYTETVEDFLLGTPLNVTAIAVGPDGAIYFAKGGRNTEGGIYRVVYRGSDAPRPAGAATPVEEALAQPQPRSAWARAAIRRAQAAAGTAWASALTVIAASGTESPERRVRALELLQVYGPAPNVPTLRTLATDEAPGVRAAATYYLGLHASDEARRALADRLNDLDPLVARRAAEALVRSGIHPAMTSPVDPIADVLPLLGHPDRFVRYAGRDLLRRINRNRWSAQAFAIETFPAATEALVVLAQTTTAATDIRPLLNRQLELLKAGVPDAHLPAFLRAVHLAMIRDAGVNHAAVYNEMATLLLPRFPSGTSALDRELALTFARIGTADAVPKLTSRLVDAPGVSREDQIFFVYALRVMPTGWQPSDREAVVGWFRKTQSERWRGGASFTGFLEKLWTDVLAFYPENERAAALATLPSFEPPAAAGQPYRSNRPNAAAVSNEELFEFMMYDPMAYTGTADQGAAAFEKAQCATCHRFGDLGRDAAPDLTDVGRRFRRQDLLEAIIFPARTVSDQWTTVPQMPEGLLHLLELQEIQHLLAFLERGPVAATPPAAGGQGARAIDMATAPPPIAAAVGRADQAIKELQSTLVARLTSELSRGGPAAAVRVCRDEAQQLTASVAVKHAIAIGRTSHRLRNPANAPRPWAEPVVRAHAGRRAADARPATFDLGGRVGVLRPIGTLDFCVNCHGPQSVVDAAIGDVLKAAYPNDQAVGFAPGDLRGWIWAEADIR